MWPVNITNHQSWMFWGVAAAGGKKWFVFTLKEDMKQSVLNLITTLFY